MKRDQLIWTILARRRRGRTVGPGGVQRSGNGPRVHPYDRLAGRCHRTDASQLRRVCARRAGAAGTDGISIQHGRAQSGSGWRRSSRSPFFRSSTADNPFYKVAESVLVGVSAAYWMVVAFWDVLVPNLIGQLVAGDSCRAGRCLGSRVARRSATSGTSCR